jgi:hypothetical protein
MTIFDAIILFLAGLSPAHSMLWRVANIVQASGRINYAWVAIGNWQDPQSFDRFTFVVLPHFTGSLTPHRTGRRF